MAAGCGKKGPPLAPLIPVPAAVDHISATRVGSDVYVSLTVPSANIDEFAPADIARIEVFGYTGRTPPPRTRWVEFGTLVATIPIAPVAPADGQPPDGGVVDAPKQGSQVTIVDTLGVEELVPGKEAARDPQTAAGRSGAGTPNLEPGTRNLEPRTGNMEQGTGNVEPGTRNLEAEEAPNLFRFYTAFPFSRRGRPGPPGANAQVPMLPLPAPPPAVRIEYDEKAMTVTWEPSGGLLAFLLARALPEESLPPELENLPDLPQAPAASAPVLYNVYRVARPDPFAPQEETPVDERWNPQPPTPLNPAPLATFEFADAVEFGRERCYTVRPVIAGATPRVGDAAPPACIVAVDTFPPAVPEGLATVASEGVINLIWEPNADRDVAGYLVLRGEAPGDTLLPLTSTPIKEARYRDAAVTPGVRYVYAVVAVDNRFPVPNLSAASARVEETAR